MLRDGMKHGFAQSDWDAAKDEAREIMIERAKVRGIDRLFRLSQADQKHKD